MKNKTLKISFVLLFIGQILYAQSARTFIKGTNIVGETPTSGFAVYIEIFNVSYSTTNDRLITTQPVLNKPNEKAQTGVLSFKKIKSKNSQIFFDIMRGSVSDGFTDVEIAFAKFIPNSYHTYLNFKAKNVRVLSIKDNGDFTETIELLMPKVFIFYRPTNPTTGQLDPPINYGWDFLTYAAWNGS
ncbi:hypothetical protein [Emticicia sp. SJ17W-69]|uniref:hypothetical protein n=1 Tax=Emticicia sp. SJ17W-69 TaxID=3421657 RepID=UPI003EC0AD03